MLSSKFYTKFIVFSFLFILTSINIFSKPWNSSTDIRTEFNIEGHDSAAVTEINYSEVDSAAGNLTIKTKPDSTINLSSLTTDKSKTAPNSEYVPKWHEMITNLPNDMVKYYNTELTKENIPYFVGITVATIGLIATDDATWKASDKFYKQSPLNKSLSDFFTDYGDGRSQFALAGLFAAYGLIDNNSRALRTASQIVEAVLASGGVVQVLKHLTGRESPFISAIPGGTWRFFPNQIEYHKHVAKYDAFPSGHVTTSLAAVIVCAENYPEYKWIKPVGYTFTALLGIGMVNKGIHWYSDYPLAIALGYAFGKIIAHPEIDTAPKAQESDKKVTLNFSPYFNYNGTGLTLSLHF